MKNLMQLLKQDDFKINVHLQELANDDYENEFISCCNHEVELNNKEGHYFIVEIEMDVYHYRHIDVNNEMTDSIIDRTEVTNLYYVDNEIEQIMTVQELEDNMNELELIMESK